jgi:hypothetical protein
MRKTILGAFAAIIALALVAAAPYDTKKFSDRYLLEKLNSDVGAITGVPATRVLTVDTAAVPVTGKVYTTIAAAITYIGTQTHDATHPWVINAGSTVNATASSDLPTYTRMTSYRGTIANTLDQQLSSVTANAILAGKVIATSQAVTVADSGNGSAATATVTPSSSFIELTCSDADGCTMTMSETGATDGQVVTIVNVSANAATFADTSSVTEAAGSFAAGQWDAITYRYVVDRWVEVSRSNN